MNNPFYRAWLPTSTSPIMIASIDEFEHFVTLPPDQISQALASAFDDPQNDGSSLRSILAQYDNQRNAVIDAAFEANPWFAALPE